MKTLIIKGSRSFTTCRTAALAILLILSAQLTFAQKPSASTSFSARPGQGDYPEKLATGNASARFSTLRLPEVLLKSNVTNANSFFKGRFNNAKHAGFGVLGEVAAMTTVPFFIPAGSGRLRAYLSLKRDGITIQPKGPANFHYAAIDLKIKF